MGKVYKHYNDYQDREVLRSLGTPPLTGNLVPTYFIEEEFKGETINPEEIEELIQYETAEDEMDMVDLKRTIRDTLDSMTRREAKVLCLRFGIELAEEATLDHIAHVFNVTRERIRQIEAKALRKMRHPARSKKLHQYVIDDAEGTSVFDEANEPPPTWADYDCYSPLRAMELYEQDRLAWLSRVTKAQEKIKELYKNLKGLI